jgi:hypothetical protein
MAAVQPGGTNNIGPSAVHKKYVHCTKNQAIPLWIQRYK